jgi:hypothetical protein
MYKIDIDFDDSSAQWLLNKIKKSNATYYYKCEKQCKNGNKCCKKVWNQTIYCKIHQNKI